MRWNKMSISEFLFSAKLDDKEVKQIVACLSKQVMRNDVICHSTFCIVGATTKMEMEFGVSNAAVIELRETFYCYGVSTLNQTSSKHIVNLTVRSHLA